MTDPSLADLITLTDPRCPDPDCPGTLHTTQHEVFGPISLSTMACDTCTIELRLEAERIPDD